MMKLAGKKLGDSHDETVSFLSGYPRDRKRTDNCTREQSFKQSDLPKDVQIVKPGDAKTSSAEKKWV